MSQELLQGLGSVKTNGSSVKMEDDHLLFTGNTWPSVTESYIPIQNCTNTFEYDIIYESEAGNYFYIGIERYAADKTTGSNSSCIYQIDTHNNAKAKQRVRGTINLNQDTSSGNKTAFIRLRILNQWSGSSGTDVTAKLYHLSVREITEHTNKISVKKNGILTTDTIWEGYNPAGFNKLNVVESNQIYEY